MFELRVERFIAAPREKVWPILADRQEEWWTPAPWRTEIVCQDRRAGGRSSIIMHGPDGEEMPEEGIFLAWEEGHRFVVTDAIAVGGDGTFHAATPFMIGSWSIESDGDGTRYVGSARHFTEEGYNQHMDMGFEAGWGAVADQLKALCENQG